MLIILNIRRRLINPGFDYLKKRGFTSETLKEFDIMYYSGTDVYSFDTTRSKGICDAVRPLFKSTFAHSVLFPVFDIYGTLVACAARRLDGTKPKYDASVFSKGEILYGLNKTVQDVIDKDAVFVTEGAFDFLMLRQYGIRNCVSSYGCALTFMQMMTCMRFTKNFYIVYDNDDAGRRGSSKAQKLLKENKCNCKIVTLSCDVDEYLLKYGAEGLLQRA